MGYNDCVNFKVLQRRILLQVERAPGEKNLLERNGCGYKVDPLTSVLTLEKHLHTMVRFYSNAVQQLMLMTIFTKLKLHRMSEQKLFLIRCMLITEHATK